jgi:hypothetical protein
VRGLVFYSRRTIVLRIPLTTRSQEWISGRSLAGIVGSNPTGGAMDVCLVWLMCVLSCRCLCNGRSLVQSSPTEYVALSVIRCNNNPLHLQWVGKRRQTKKEYLSEKKNSWTYLTNADRYYTQAHSGIWLCPLDVLQIGSQSSIPLFHLTRIVLHNINQTNTYFLT